MATVTLNPKITQAGLAIAPSPQNPGLNVQLTHVSLGTGRYIPVGNETAMKAEVARYAITSGTNPSPRVIQVGLTITDLDATGRSPNGKGIGEVGFWAGNTLFAVWSQDAEPIFYKSSQFDIPMAYTLDVSALPANSVTVTVNVAKQGLESLILAHEAKTDPHPQYLTPAEADTLYTPLSHASAADPHPQYLTPAEGNAAYTPLAHASAVDPHTQYLTPARGNGYYVKQGGGAGQGANMVYLGWSGSYLKAQVDATDLGNIATHSWVNTLINNVIGAAPATLDQIAELAAAIGNDPNFTVTIANQLAGKERKFDAGVRLVCANATAPVGWTQINDDSTNNRLMRVVNGGGAGIGGIHDPVYNNVVPSHTHGFQTGNESANHSHSVSDPGHAHGGGQMVGGLGYVGSGNGNIEEGQGNPNYPMTWMQAATTNISIGGITADHYHTGVTDNGSSQTAWQPRYLNLIVIQKN